MRGRGQPSVDGNGKVSAPADESLAGRVRRILATQKGALVALFPREGEACVHRAVSIALGQARRLKEDTDAGSVAECVVAAMRLDLELGTQCYLVPFSKRATLIIGPEGVVELMFRSGHVRKVMARAVMQGDEFEYQLGSKEYVKHRPVGRWPLDAPGIWASLQAAYVTIETTAGGEYVHVLERDQIEYHRSKSPSGSSPDGLWAKWPAEAARKTVLKQGAKFVPRGKAMSSIFVESEQHGGIEIPQEILDAVHSRAAGAQVQVPGDVETVSATAQQEAGRQPGEEG